MQPVFKLNIQMTNTVEKAEEWRPVVGFEDRYEVSSIGRVASLYFGRKIMRPHVSRRHGYRKVGIHRDNWFRTTSIHRLVAEAFLERIPGKNVVNHKDGNKVNDCVENLEWCTTRENALHAQAHGLLATGLRSGAYTKPENRRRGETHGMAKITDDVVRFIRSDIAKPLTNIAIGRMIGMTNAAISKIRLHQSWQHVA